MKKIITGACILLVTLMFSPAMAQDGPNERLNRQGDRYGDRRVDGGKDHFRGQRSTRFANPRGQRAYQKNFSRNNNHRRHMYYRSNNRYNRHMNSRGYKRQSRHMYSRFGNRYPRHLYSMRNHRQYRHRNNWQTAPKGPEKSERRFK
mgnify:CR=1 FL=1